MAEVDVSDALSRLFDGFDEVVSRLGEEFTAEEARRRLTQRNQQAYIDLLARCRDYEHPFGVAHWFIGDALRARLAALGYQRRERGRADGEHNIFGGLTRTVVFWRGPRDPALHLPRRNQKQPGESQRLLFEVELESPVPT